MAKSAHNLALTEDSHSTREPARTGDERGGRSETASLASPDGTGQPPRKGLARATASAPRAGSSPRADFDFRLQVKEMLADAIQGRREEVAEAMTAMGVPTSVSKLNHWTRASGGKDLAAGLLPALVRATGSDRVLRVLADAVGLRIGDARVFGLGEAVLRLRRAKRDIDDLAAEILRDESGFWRVA